MYVVYNIWLDLVVNCYFSCLFAWYEHFALFVVCFICICKSIVVAVVCLLVVVVCSCCCLLLLFRFWVVCCCCLLLDFLGVEIWYCK